MKFMVNEIEKLLQEQFTQVVEWRQYMHQYPELSFKEEKTAEFIIAELEKMDVTISKNIGGYGIVAKLQGTNPGPTIAFRADFDALPITDLKEAVYQSKNEGVSHACGHDGHTSALLGFAKAITQKKDQLYGNIIFIFQPAEETPPGGAKFMIEDGALTDVDVIFGAHLDSGNPVGTVAVGDGYRMAAVDKFKITLQGLGGHGAKPHETKDAIVLGAKLVNDLQQIVARRLDPFSPAVVTVGIFQAGSAFNIIADSAIIEGTVRTMTEEVRQKIKQEIYAIVESATEAIKASFEIDYLHGYPALYNHPKETALLKTLVDDAKVIDLEPSMGAEDFAYYLLEKPGTYFKVGSHDGTEETQYPHHHPKFDFDETALLVIQKTFLQIAKYYVLKED